jgi:hypothetical protein
LSDIHIAPMRAGAPSGSPSAYTDPKVIDALLKSSNPEKVAESGQSYQKLAATYEKIANELLGMGGDLNEAWRGKDAAAAQSQLREVWDSAAKVQKTASDFGVAVERHGSEYLAWYKYNKPHSTNLAEAQNWMTGANQRISQSWDSLPQEISTSLPPAPHDRRGNPATDTGFTTGGSGGTTFSPGGTHSSLPTGGTIHGTPSGGATLADFNSGGPPQSLSSGLSAGGTGGGLPTGATTGGLGGLGGVGGVESGGVIGTSGGLSSGTAQSAAAAEEAEAAAASRSGIMGPMLGGGAGGNSQEQERRRDHWLAEDTETWENDEAAPPVIGKHEPEPDEPEPELPAEVDLTNDDDIADLLGELDEDQPADPAAEIAALRAKLERLERQVGPDKPAGDDTADGLGWMAGEDM